MTIDLNEYTESSFDDLILNIASQDTFMSEIEFLVPDVKRWRRMLVPAVQYLHEHRPNIPVSVKSSKELTRFQIGLLTSLGITWE